MPFALYRIDDRLVHGQVVLGWGRPLHAGFIVMVDDTVAVSDWERELYRMGVPPEVELSFATVADAADAAPMWAGDPRPGILLTADIPTMTALCEAGVPIPRINLGGIHHRPGRRQRLPYIFLTDEEYRMLETLAARGTEVTAQDLPATPPVRLGDLG